VGTVNVNRWGVSPGVAYSGRKRSGKGFSLSPLSFNNVVRSKSISYD
jgi:acyl-CoA reductase-like NAD-dependent aldehyde dehydrogenase